MFEYEFTQENYPKKLDTTGFTDSPEDIKNEILESRSNFKHVRSTYPNGFVMEVEQYSTKLIIRSNWEIVVESNGIAHIIEPTKANS